MSKHGELTGEEALALSKKYTDDAVAGGGVSAVKSVNGKRGEVTLNASDVGALPDNTPIPSNTSDLNNNSNFVSDPNYVHTDNNYDSASKEIVDGVTSALSGKQNTLTFDNTPTENSDNPVKSNGVYTADMNEAKTRGALGAKNLLPYPYKDTTTTSCGILFTDNGDGSVEISGTNDNTSSSYFNCNSIGTNPLYLEDIDYIWSADIDIDNVRLTLVVKKEDGITDDIVYICNKNTKSIVVHGKSGRKCVTYIRITSGTVISSPITIKPMLRLATDLDPTYQPYSYTNQEATTKIDGLNASVSNEVKVRALTGVHNIQSQNVDAVRLSGTLVGYKANSVNGLTLTFYDDGRIKIDGTPTDSSKNIDIRLDFGNRNEKYIDISYLDGKKVIASAADSDVNGLKYKIGCFVASGNAAQSTNEGIAPFEYTYPSGTKWARGYISISGAYSYDNVIIYPQIVIAEDSYSEKTPFAKTNQQLTNDISELHNILGLDPTNPSILGLQIDFANKTFTRLAGAENLTAGTDFDTFPEFGGRKRCIVNDSGEVVKYYGDTGYVEDGSLGQVMVEQPAFYYRVQPLKLEKNTATGIGYHLRKANYYVSHIPHPGFKLHPAFYDKDGNAVSKIYIGAYEGCIYDTSTSAYITDDSQVMDNTADKFSSIANAKPASGLTQDLTRVKIEQMAQNRGINWHIETAKTAAVTQLLAMIEYATPNVQSTIGKGVVSKTDDGSTNMANNTGATASLGNASGRQSGTDGFTSVTYRGEENAWGNIWKFVYGINIWGNGSMGGGEPYICKDFNFAESKNSDNYDGAGFTVTNAGGYISAFGYGKEEYDWLMIASETAGNDALPVGDYTYVTSNLNGYRLALLGAAWAYGLRAGLFCWALHSGVGHRSRDIGGRLVCVPTE